MIGHLCLDAGAPLVLGRVLEQLQTCCLGSLEDGPSACSCWEPEYDLTQEPRAGFGLDDERAQLAVLVVSVPIVTLALRKPVAYRHPAGLRVAADSDGYLPPIVEIDNHLIPLKANGTPADRCAGFESYVGRR